MADTRRLRQGYETVAMAMSHEDAMRLRVGATLARLSLGDYVASLLPREPMASGTGKSGPGGLARAATRASQRLQEPRGEQGAPQEAPMAWEDLVAALRARGPGSQKALAAYLGLTNISVWRTGVPVRHAARIREFLAQSQAPEGE